MSSDTTCVINSKSLNATLAVAERLGRKLRGSEVIELLSDLGGGKTVFVRGLAKGIGSETRVQSPTFTLSRIYRGEKGLELHHFDFYRLDEPGIIKEALSEVIGKPNVIVTIEWADIVLDVLPKGRLQVQLVATGENSRRITFKATDQKHAELLRGLK